MKSIRNEWRPLLAVMLLLLLLTLSGCASASIVYVRDSSRPVPIKAGEKSPIDGYVLSPAARVDLTDCCEQRLDDGRD